MIHVTLVCALRAREVFETALKLPEGSCLLDAVRASALAAGDDALCVQTLTPGIWGQRASWEQVLCDGDRVELCRPLRVDPKTARRKRFARQGAGTAGLFAQRRPGAKPGY
ncbi:MAG: RnfH family protein [Burkholderiaceae bacterium]|jgi:putative ubiquitin-RnfH superfamily antitoxin RatB of RatAB toxin-antitoxin module|nr:RnfH family protein [Burkholderiaceae bacterium]